ncbi:CoA-transferase [Noviherbaspirillum sp. Root189]|nr:CoA-transferase [Noviherbaspirillum sp. Root189]
MTALNGLRVLDLSRILAGPWSSQILADLGAEVIKVERPRQGDDSRRWEPSVPLGENGVAASAYFCAANRGKQSITVNLASAEGADIIRRLAEVSDVLIENYKADDLARYGLGYEDLSKINPRLVYCSITGFGQTGPYRARAGYDTIIQAMGGLMSITGERDDRPGGGAQRSGMPVIDLMTGIYAAVAILAALRHRDASGVGQHLDLSLLDVQVSSLAYFGLNYLATGRIQSRMGNTNPVTHPSGVYSCADRQIVILVGNDDQFARFCVILGLPELARDERFASSGLRVQHSAALDCQIIPVLQSATASVWINKLEQVGVPCGPINDMAAVFSDPHIQARGAATSVSHPELGEIPILASPIRMSVTPVQYCLAPPLLGEHTRDVLSRLLGFGGKDFDELCSKGIV